MNNTWLFILQAATLFLVLALSATAIPAAQPSDGAGHGLSDRAG